MKLPLDLTAAVVKATAKEIADRIGPMDDLRLFTLPQVAERLQISRSRATEICKEYVSLGEASPRVTPGQLRDLIAKRTCFKQANGKESA